MIPTSASTPRPDKPLRLAAIDVGTNSIRLIVVEVALDGSYKVIDDEKDVARLGRGLASSGELKPKAMRESALAIARMKGIADGYGVQRLRAVGTCAVREAANREAFLSLVRQECGLTLEVISAEEEARLAHLSVIHAFDLRSMQAAVVDIGGGSTEVVLSSGGVVEELATFPLGAVRLAEMFGPMDGKDFGSYRRMRKHIRKTIDRTLGKTPFTPQLIVGTGGTFTTLAAISMHASSRLHGGGGEDLLPFTVRGYEMQRSEVKHLLERLASMTVRERERLPGLGEDRAEIIVGGAAIIEGMMKHLRVNALRVHDRGIRDGLILTMIHEVMPRTIRPELQPLDRMKAVRHFAAACRYEEAHSLHVAGLSLQLFDQLAAHAADPPGGWSDPVNRELLEAAAVLHDVGYYINYSRHHKHSYHLIIHSELAGFTHREIEVIANVARYHRLAEPKKKHPNFAKLPREDRRLVRRLAAILRVADGLDRAHTQEVRRIELRMSQDNSATLLLYADRQPDIGAWGAQRKGRLFEKGFKTGLAFQWQPPVSGTEAAGHVQDRQIPRAGP